MRIANLDDSLRAARNRADAAEAKLTEIHDAVKGYYRGEHLDKLSAFDAIAAVFAREGGAS
ncbi:hypothetical protein ACFPN7_22030 [Amycolatopsis halotolerans]